MCCVVLSATPFAIPAKLQIRPETPLCTITLVTSPDCLGAGQKKGCWSNVKDVKDRPSSFLSRPIQGLSLNWHDNRGWQQHNRIIVNCIDNDTDKGRDKKNLLGEILNPLIEDRFDNNDKCKNIYDNSG